MAARPLIFALANPDPEISYPEAVAARPDDELVDLFPGTGAVTEAWRTWRGKFTLPDGPLFNPQIVEARS